MRNVSVLVAIGVNADGDRDRLGICGGAKEDKAGWSAKRYLNMELLQKKKPNNERTT